VGVDRDDARHVVERDVLDGRELAQVGVSHCRP
jgi:hypothetical protein